LHPDSHDPAGLSITAVLAMSGQSEITCTQLCSRLSKLSGVAINVEEIAALSKLPTLVLALDASLAGMESHQKQCHCYAVSYAQAAATRRRKLLDRSRPAAAASQQLPSGPSLPPKDAVHDDTHKRDELAHRKHVRSLARHLNRRRLAHGPAKPRGLAALPAGAILQDYFSPHAEIQHVALTCTTRTSSVAQDMGDQACSAPSSAHPLPHTAPSTATPSHHTPTPPHRYMSSRWVSSATGSGVASPALLQPGLGQERQAEGRTSVRSPIHNMSVRYGAKKHDE